MAAVTFPTSSPRKQDDTEGVSAGPGTKGRGEKTPYTLTVSGKTASILVFSVAALKGLTM
jgi:hypothetical protein